MRIGILTFHLPTNFGANLQAFASSRYFSSIGHEVFVLNYARKEDLNNVRGTGVVQSAAHRAFVNSHLPLTKEVKTSTELAALVKELSINLVVIGADAVWRSPKDDDVFFAKWLFLDEQLKNVPVVSMSAAHMGVGFKELGEERMKDISSYLSQFKYISVRDEWTRDVVNRDFFKGERHVSVINPDPVFTLRLNGDEDCWDCQGIEKGSYIVMTLPLKWCRGRIAGRLHKLWFSAFKRVVNRAGFKLVELPLPEGVSGLEFDHTVKYPIDPLQWFLWIRHSRAFIGLRFHAIVSCIANGVPFFSLDSYAEGNAKKSKIYNLLKGSEYENNRTEELYKVNPLSLFKNLISISRDDIIVFRDEKAELFDQNMNEMLAMVERKNRKIVTLTDSCTGCFACSNACPVSAITLPENDEGFYFPKVDYRKCIQCGLCDMVCPQIKEHEHNRMQKAWYGKSVNHEIQKASSSGGLFSTLSHKILLSDGIVYGAAFNYQPFLRLECHSTEEVGLKELQKSKYVQSYIGDAFIKILADLKTGRPVLFCGTPCQVDGLKSFLRKDYPNLYTADFVCHGVPSMKMLQGHLNMLGLKNVKSIDFRPKRVAWVDDLFIEYGNGRSYLNYWRNDEYFCSFERCRSIRRSCFSCHYCNGDRAADISLADFWGYKQYDPSIYDPNGLSLVLANTEKGILLVQSLIDEHMCDLKTLPLEYAEYAYKRLRNEDQNGYDTKVRNKFFNYVVKDGYQSALKIMGWYNEDRKKNMLRYNVMAKVKSILSH